MRTKTTRWQAAAVAVLTVLALACVGSPAAATPPGPLSGPLSAEALGAMFGAYGDAGGHWTGGDGTTSVALPDGRVVWLFADTFLGTVNPDHSRPASSPIVNNTMVVQNGTTLGPTLHGGRPDAPEALVKPRQPGEYFWVGDGIVDDNAVKVFYNGYRKTGTGGLDFTLTGSALATFELPSLALRSVVDLPYGAVASWGSAILPDGEYTYVYGTSSAPGRLKFGHVARARTGDLEGPWQFWTGSTWSTDHTSAARLLSGVGSSISVQRVGSQYVLVTRENNLIFDSQFVAYTAPSPTGPFTGPVHLYTAPEAGGQKMVYDARLHPELARDGKLLMSYNVNSLTYADNLADARIYRPRFVELSWPPAAPGPGVPAAPAGLTVTARNDFADLSWSPVGGATSYRIYQRDVTGGQTHFARQPAPVTGTSHRVGLLVTGHRYEFRVAAVNAAGEGLAGGTATATPHSTKPVAEAVRGANGPASIPGVYMVRLKAGTVQPERVAEYARQLVDQAGGTLGPVLPRALRGFGATLTEAQAVNLAAHPDVLDVEQDSASTPTSEQSDPPWHLDRIDQRNLPLDKKYVYPNEGAVRAYVVDTGIRASHEDFGGRVTAGFSAVDGTTNTGDCSSSGGHGTKVASALGGAEHGVAKGAQIVPVKVFECLPDGGLRGSTLTAVRGIDWVITDAEGAGRKPAVVNLSLGSTLNTADTNNLDNAILAALGSGLTVVGAAGNTGGDACDSSPGKLAKSSALISVGATNKADQVPTFSERGPCVDLFAPGSDVPVATSISDTDTDTDGGTSIASPQVAGAAAILLQAHPEYSPADVKKALLAAATKDKLTGVGTGSPNRLLYIERPPTQAPTGLTATANSDGTIGLRWDPVNEQNIHYVVSSRDVTAGETDFRRWPSPVFDATVATARDLEDGHRYEFRVAAANSAGTGPQSNVASAVSDLSPPPAPTGLAASSNPDGTIRLTWNSLGDDVWYWVYQRDVTAGETEFAKLPLPITATSLNAGYLTHAHEYEYKVSGFHRGGEGPASAVVRARSTYPPPGPPTGLTGMAGNGEVTLSWSASSDPDVWYIVHQRDVTLGETQFSALPLPITKCCTMTAGYLANGHTYEFAVSATGRGGESGRSNVVRVVPQVPLPGKVTGLTATAQPDGGIRLEWTPPGPNVWFDVYQRDVTAGQAEFSKLPLPVTTCCTFTAGLLTHNHAYEFKLAATNAAGAGPLSDVARATARIDRPGPPRNLRGTTAGDGSIELHWDAPGPGGFFYWVYQRDVTAGESTLVRSGYPTDQTSARLTQLRHGHVYEFAVTAENLGGESPRSATVQITSYGGLPAPPTGLTASAGDGQATLRWTASPTSGVLYTVYQRDTTTGESWQRLPLPSQGTSATLGYLTNGHTYQFKVSASNASGESEASNVAGARPMPPLPQAPSGLAAAAGDGTVTLRWNASPSQHVYYWIDYRPAGGTWQRLQYPVSNCCSFTVSYLSNGTTYEFAVRATNLAGDSPPSNVASARPMPPLPQAPSNLRATPGDGTVTLDWQASPTRNVFYWVDYRVAGGGWQRLQYPVSTCCSFTVSYLMNGPMHEFAVRATNLAGDSPPSNVASATPMPPIPQAPSYLQASRIDNNTAWLTWRATPTPRVYYRIQKRNVSRGGVWTNALLYVSETTARVPYLTAGDLYEFRVMAENLSGVGPPTNVASLRMSYALASVTCTDWSFTGPGGVPIGWTDVNTSAAGVAGRSGVTIKVTRKLYWNGRWYATIENWPVTGGDGSWRVRDIGYALSPGRYDLYVWAEGPNGESWGYHHDFCD